MVHACTDVRPAWPNLSHCQVLPHAGPLPKDRALGHLYVITHLLLNGELTHLLLYAQSLTLEW